MPNRSSPPDIRIVVTRRGEATVFAVPPAGYGLGGLFLSLVGGLYLVASLVHVWYFFDVVRAAPQGVGNARLGQFVLLLFFCWLNGLGLIGLALVYASRRATFIVRAGGLRIVEASVLRGKAAEWGPGEILSVRAAGVTLEVGLANGEDFTWGAGIPWQVSEAEVAWLAAELRAALGLASRGREPPEGAIRQPPRAGGRP